MRRNRDEGIMPQNVYEVVRNQLNAMRIVMRQSFIMDISSYDAFAMLVPDEAPRMALVAAGRYLEQDTLGTYVSSGHQRLYMELNGDDDVRQFLLPHWFQSGGAHHIDSPELRKAIQPYVAVNREWTLLLEALEWANGWVKDPCQFNYFMPWLSDAIVRAGSPYKDNNRVQRIVERKAPKHIPSMHKSLLDVCRSGGKLIAMHDLINTHEPLPEHKPGMCRVTLTSVGGHGSEFEKLLSGAM